MIKRRSYLVLVIIGFALALGTARRVDAASLEEFGRCLTRNGAIFYGASWCPHCHVQRQTLGDAMSHVKYVECAVEGRGGGAPACKSAGVNSYPTWIFADGHLQGFLNYTSTGFLDATQPIFMLAILVVARPRQVRAAAIPSGER